LKDKTRDERLDYWTERTRILRERQSDGSAPSHSPDE
jgi:hypothetical protein